MSTIVKTYRVGVSLSEDLSERGDLGGLGETDQLGVHGQRGGDAGVDDALDRGHLRGGQRGGPGEVEAQLVRVHERALLVAQLQTLAGLCLRLRKDIKKGLEKH